MSKEVSFTDMKIDELIDFLERLPKDYDVLLYDMDKPLIGREFTLKIFGDEKLVEVY